ncbi:SPIRAL1-like1 [Forsythia ovata]|uniref:SPIRAL1-like1 n=1 Tax=Forsythia ovata TaxID=205694 RepID=A0ABD1SM51_9LAMI
MGRGVSSGGGQSSLGYLFRNAETPAQHPASAVSKVVSEKTPAVAPPADVSKQIPAGIHRRLSAVECPRSTKRLQAKCDLLPHNPLLKLLDTRYRAIAQGVGQSEIIGWIHVAPIKDCRQ